MDAVKENIKKCGVTEQHARERMRSRQRIRCGKA